MQKDKAVITARNDFLESQPVQPKTIENFETADFEQHEVHGRRLFSSAFINPR
jgi:hypothetical protein